MADLHQKLHSSSSSSSDDSRLADEVKAGFFKKVFGIIAFQLVLTAGICAVCMTNGDLKEYMLENIWLLIVAAVTACVLMLLPLCIKALRQRVPYNYINLVLFVTAT